nr:hypothetical protein [Gammaproteobacteria bacterium]
MEVEFLTRARLGIMRLKAKGLLSAVAVASFGFGMSAHADCPFPKAPDHIPDGRTASEAEMIAAMNEFKAYNDAVVAFQNCLDEETKAKSASGGATMAFKAMQAKKLDAAVKELEAKAKKFNEQVRIFKARSG